MKLNLNAQELEIILNFNHCYNGAICKSKAMQKLVSLGLFRDSGDVSPLFMRTIQGDMVRDSLYILLDKQVIKN